jgi:glycosyltransferase involved in cell wall biosynthesis
MRTREPELKPVPMRLLQLCTAFRTGGIQRHVLGLTASLRARGHHVAMAGTPGNWLTNGSDEAFLALNLDGVSDQGGALPRRLLNTVRAAARLRPFLRRERIELIHAHESAPALVAMVAAVGMSIPTLVTYHGSEPERVAMFARIARLVACRVITPSQRCADDLRCAGLPGSTIEVVGLGVAARPPVDKVAAQHIRARLLGKDGRLLVVTVARLAHQKGIDVLVEVVRRACAQREDIRFVIVGDGPLRDDVRRWIAQAGIDKFVVLAGHSERPDEFLAAADLFLLSSRWEGLPITIVEAFQAGLPVVATDAGGVRELVDDMVGSVVAIGDVEALTREVLTICGDDGLRARLAVNALRRAGEERFSPSYVLGVIERTYTETLAAASPASARV